MAIDFKPGFPQQAMSGTNIIDEISGSYARASQLAEAAKVRREQSNLESFEEDVSKLFYSNSIVKGKLSNMNGNYTWNGTEKLPSKQTARANYEYLARKHNIKMDFEMSQKFDQLYGGMLQGYGTQLNNQIQNLISQGARVKDIQEAATTPEFANILNTLSNEGLGEFSNYLPKPSTMDNIMRRVGEMGPIETGLTLGAGVPTAIGLGAAAMEYGPGAKDWLFGKDVVKTVQGSPLYGAKSQMIAKNARDALKVSIAKNVGDWQPKGRKWKYDPVKYAKKGFGGYNTKDAQKAAQKLFNQQKYHRPQTGTGISFDKSFQKGKLPKFTATGLKGLGYSYLPSIAGSLGEVVGGEEGAVAGRAAGTLFMAKQLVGPGTGAKTALKQAAKQGFGSFVKATLSKSLAKKIGVSAALSMADGPLPFGEIASIMMNIGWTAWEIKNAWQAYQKLK